MSGKGCAPPALILTLRTSIDRYSYRVAGQESETRKTKKKIARQPPTMARSNLVHGSKEQSTMEKKNPYGRGHTLGTRYK